MIFTFILSNWFWFSLPFLLYFNHLWIFGLWKAFHVEFVSDDYPGAGVINKSKSVLWFVTVWSVNKFGWHVSKTVCLCPPCMASLHSTYLYWSLALCFGFTPVMIPVYIFYVGCLAGYNELRMNDN